VIPKGAVSAFNQFHVIVSNLKKRDIFQEKLLTHEIQTYLMYEEPLHHIFPELNKPGSDSFHNVIFLAKTLSNNPAPITDKNIYPFNFSGSG